MPNNFRRSKQSMEKYKKYFDSKKELHLDHSEGFYKAWKEKRAPRGKEVIQVHDRLETRFDHCYSIKHLTIEVRRELKELLAKKKGFFGIITDMTKFAATTAAFFIGLLVLFNFPTYLSYAGFLWDSYVFGSEERLEKFAHFTDEAELLPDGIPFSVDARGFVGKMPTNIASETKGPLEGSSSFLSNLQITPPDNRIVIPSIGQNIPIQDVSTKNLIAQNWKALEDDIQKQLQYGVVRYPGTAKPGDIGNVFITGHSSYYLWDPGRYKDVFALLHNVEVGDTVTVYYGQDAYHYEIIEKRVVSPDDVDVLKQTDDRRLTLMTCTPIGTALNRLIVIAEQKD